MALIDQGVIRACSSGAVVVQTRSTNDGPILHIVPRHALHSRVAEARQPELLRVTPQPSPGQPQPTNEKE